MGLVLMHLGIAGFCAVQTWIAAEHGYSWAAAMFAAFFGGNVVEALNHIGKLAPGKEPRK